MPVRLAENGPHPVLTEKIVMADAAAQRHPDPQADLAVARAWEDFQNGAGLPRGTLRPLVGGSWQRCAQAHVDPHRDRGPQPISDQDLYLLRERRRDLLCASAPALACAREHLAEGGSLMALTDPNGTILCSEGDRPTLELAETIRLMPGARWSETLCGTNAIGTALATGKPAQIHSAEHYCAGIQRWTCAAAVLRHPSDGGVIGAIDVSGLSASFNRQSLALVLATARSIESGLLMGDMQRRMRLLDKALGAWPREGRVAAVLFDRRGVAVKASEHACLAIADAGGPLDLAGVRPLPELGMNMVGRGARARLPAWLREEWLQCVVADGEYLGALLVLPLGARRRCLPSATAVNAGPLPLPRTAGFESIVTEDTAMRALIARTARLAKSSAPVLLLGETGVGKEEFARGLHGDRAGRQVVLNCGALSRELMASELFGYADGAFTGARKGGMVGKIEAAQGGTLFLDELGEMPLDLQPQLLRVLERREVYRLGETAPRPVDFRLVAATHRDLRQEVAQGRFRMDLYYRVAVTCLRIPPLRERGHDILLLARHFLARFRQEAGQPVERLSAEVEAALLSAAWPGNVRELRNAIEGAVLACPDLPISAPALDLEMGSVEMGSASVPEPPLAPVTTSLPSMAQSEAALIVRTLVASKGNLSLAARRLRIAKSTLYAKLRRYGLDRDGSRKV